MLVMFYFISWAVGTRHVLSYSLYYMFRRSTRTSLFGSDEEGLSYFLQEGSSMK